MEIQQRAKMAQTAQLGYSYKGALNPNRPEIRLLSILPSPQSSEIECTLDVACLDDELSYSCLSYTWGDPSDVSAIRLNNLTFTVTTSLSIALHHLRSEREIVRIWVDAICINQQDNTEKAFQVLQMAEIYMKSKHVIIWLGEEADDSSYAMSVIHDIDRRWVSRDAQVRKSYCSPHNLGTRAYQAITKLLKRPWWCRAWIIQEATCPNETYIRCGRDITDFAAFVATANCIGHAFLQTPLQYPDASDMLHLQRVYALDRLKMERGRANYRFNVIDLLENFRTCNASDPRDKIFAFSALAAGTVRAIMSPDYSISVAAAYTKFVHTFIESEGNLNILGNCQVEIQTIESWSSFRHISHSLLPTTPLPSWTPDWTMEQETTSFAKHEILEDSQSKTMYNATTSFAPLARLSDTLDTLDTLLVRGCTVDRVSLLVPEFTSPLISTTIQHWHTWAIANCGDTNYSTESLHEAFLHTIVGDIGYSQGRKGGWFRGHSAEWPVQYESDSSDLKWVIRLAIHSRRLFISEKGYIGLARFDAAIGDKICLLHGGHMPFILRQNGDAYHFKGECYVHGLMDGEGMRHPHVWEDFALQ